MDGEAILLWTLPAAGLIWLAAFFLFPGFVPPMSPTLSAEQVAAFYRDPDNLPRIRYSMIIFNWFSVGLVPILALLAIQMRRMAHRTPIFSYGVIASAASGPATFLMATLFWQLAAFRPERDPELTMLFNDMAWVTYASQGGFLIALALLIALAIFLDRQARPVFGRWVAYFNLGFAIALVPACFVGLTFEGPFAWDGTLSFGARNIALGLWITVMGAMLWRAVQRQRTGAEPAL